jgi:hypothetical protein
MVSCTYEPWYIIPLENNVEINKSMIHKMKTSIGGKVIIFSSILFLAILAGGSIAFSLSM